MGPIRRREEVFWIILGLLMNPVVVIRCLTRCTGNVIWGGVHHDGGTDGYETVFAVSGDFLYFAMLLVCLQLRGRINKVLGMSWR
jgi:hypothetical protein